MCFSYICLFVLYVLVFLIFLFLLVLGLAAVCDCGILSNYIYIYICINWCSYRCPYCMLLLLHSINGLVTQKIDKKVQMYAHESNRHRNNLFLP